MRHSQVGRRATKPAIAWRRPPYCTKVPLQRQNRSKREKMLLSGCRQEDCFPREFLIESGVVPADGEVTSQTAIGGNAYHGPAAFATTHWSVVLEAQGESPAAQEALEKLCRIYWRPIYSFVRRQEAGPEEAQDLTQGFFALFLERRDLSAVRKEKGRLRSYLLTALKHFLADERRRAMAIKRGKGQRFIPLEELRADVWTAIEPTDPVTAERIYERRWASTVLERVLNLLKDEYAATRNAALFDSLTQ